MQLFKVRDTVIQTVFHETVTSTAYLMSSVDYRLIVRIVVATMSFFACFEFLKTESVSDFGISNAIDKLFKFIAMFVYFYTTSTFVIQVIVSMKFIDSIEYEFVELISNVICHFEPFWLVVLR